MKQINNKYLKLSKVFRKNIKPYDFDDVELIASQGWEDDVAYIFELESQKGLINKTLNLIKMSLAIKKFKNIIENKTEFKPDFYCLFPSVEKPFLIYSTNVRTEYYAENHILKRKEGWRKRPYDFLHWLLGFNPSVTSLVAIKLVDNN